MSQIVVMPKLGFNQDEGVLVKWHKKAGETVKKGEPFFAIETDKTTMDMDATADGVVRKLLCEEGETVPVTVPIAIIADAGEDICALLAQTSASPRQEQAPEQHEEQGLQHKQERKEEPAPIKRITGEEIYKKILEDPAYQASRQASAKPTAPAPVAASGPKLSPRAYRMAMEMGLDIDRLMREVTGTGYDGSISGADIQNYAKTHKASPAAKAVAAAAGMDTRDIEGSGVSGRVMKKDVQDAIQAREPGVVEAQGNCVTPYAGVRKIIGERLAMSSATAPHIYFTQRVDMQALLELRSTINESRERKLSVTDYVARAVILALEKHPDMNVSLAGDKIVSYRSVNLGIAVAAPSGLIVPVVHDAQNLSIGKLAAKTSALFAKAREGKLLPDEYSGGTFTISNLGMLGIDNFTAIINPPEAAILAVSATKDDVAVVVDEDGNKTIAIRPMGNIQLSADHRVIDGYLAAQFVMQVKQLLESPLDLLV